MTERENFMRVINGQDPAWAPRFSMGIPGIQLFKKHHEPNVSLMYGIGGIGREADGKGGFVMYMAFPISLPLTPAA